MGWLINEGMVVIGSFSWPGIGSTLGFVVASAGDVLGVSVSVSLCDENGLSPPGPVVGWSGLPGPPEPPGSTTGTVVSSWWSGMT